MKVLITGANGFIGHQLVQQLLDKGHEVIATGRGNCRLVVDKTASFIYVTMDFTDPYAVHDTMERHRPEVVIHAGAMSKPDDCEQNQWQAYITNVEGTVTMLTNAIELDCFFVLLSTDFIFNGDNGPYYEDNVADPVNYYGSTKLDAEEAVKELGKSWAIVRTSMVYGNNQGLSRDFLSLVEQNVRSLKQYEVSDLQFKTPTYVGDLVKGIIMIIELRQEGVFHIAGNEFMSLYSMACQLINFLQLNSSLITKISSPIFPSVARRPLNAGLQIERAKELLEFLPVSFEEGLKLSRK